MCKSKKSTETKTFRKVVPINLREQLGRSEIKITLKGIEYKHC